GGAARARQQAEVAVVGVALDRGDGADAVADVPPVHREHPVGQQRRVGVGGGQGARLGVGAVAAGAGVELGHRDADPLRAGAGVPGDLLAGELDHVRYAVRTVERPRIPVQDHEVDLVGGGGEDDLVPASLVALGHDRVRPLGGGGGHGADLDAGVARLHRVGVGDEVAGVLGRALVVVVVGLPGGAVVAVAVVLVA